jgi:hypothetical protein
MVEDLCYHWINSPTGYFPRGQIACYLHGHEDNKEYHRRYSKTLAISDRCAVVSLGNEREPQP